MYTFHVGKLCLYDSGEKEKCLLLLKLVICFFPQNNLSCLYFIETKKAKAINAFIFYF